MVKNNLKRNLYFFCFQGGKTLIEGFAVFKVFVALSVAKFDTHSKIFSDICNTLATGILICKMLLFFKWNTHWFVLSLSNYYVISEMDCKTVTKIKQ